MCEEFRIDSGLFNSRMVRRHKFHCYACDLFRTLYKIFAQSMENQAEKTAPENTLELDRNKTKHIFFAL